MSAGARIFVIVVFAILGLSFIATTGVFLYEFLPLGIDYTLALITLYSHLFLFFPTFGIVALLAFYIPSAALVDMYWRQMGLLGRIRFVAIALSLGLVAWMLAKEITRGDVPALFAVPPVVMANDKGVPAGCGVEAGAVCERRDVLSTVVAVRKESNSRLGMSKFARACSYDQRLEPPPSFTAKRYCFVTREKMDAPSCCAAQKRFSQALAEMVAPPQTTSLTNQVHEWLLPLKIFFLLVVFFIGLTLALRGHTLSTQFAHELPRIEKGLFVGAFAMLFWPLMNHAFLQTSAVIYGADAETFFYRAAPYFSALFGLWAIFILFFVFRNKGGLEVESTGRIFSVIGGALAIFKYDTIIDFIVRIVGSGADLITLGIVVLINLSAAFFVLRNKKLPLMEKTDQGVSPVAKA